METFVNRFPSFRYSSRYGAATYVRARNCRSAQFKWLTHPMTYAQAVECARLMARKWLQIGSVVFLPENRYGRTGTIASRIYINPVEEIPVCFVQVRGERRLEMVFAVKDLQPAPIENALTELCQQWGYRDITELVRRVQTQLDATETEEENRLGGLDSLCVLQGPEGNPIYCLNERRLLLELDEARTRGRYYRQCPAPDPEQNLWMVIGEFNTDDKA